MVIRKAQHIMAHANIMRMVMLIMAFNFQFSIFNLCWAQRHTVYADDIGMVKVVAGTYHSTNCHTSTIATHTA